MNLFKRLTQAVRRTDRKNAARNRNVQLELESLEAREVPATITTYAGVLFISGTESGDRVELGTNWAYSGLDHVYVTVNGADAGEFLGVSKVRFYGKGGDDWFVNNTKTPCYFDGGSGIDTAFGGSGADELRGGSERDYLFGRGGNDSLFGGTGNDYLAGGAHHDSLYGERDSDTLYGGTGNDGLFGGIDTSATRDYLYGQGGKDRFLRADDNDRIRDKESHDATIEFKRSRADWNDREIEVMDIALRTLHHKTGNTILLKDPLNPDEPLRIYKLGSHPSIAAYNDPGLRAIFVYNWAESDSRDWSRNWWAPSKSKFSSLDLQRASSLVHEIGHNWDEYDELGAYPQLEYALALFRWQSGWTNREPHNPNDYEMKVDNRGETWWYGKNFIGFSTRWEGDTYGQTNPREDWGTSWQVYFNYAYQGGYPNASMPQQKIQILDYFFSVLSTYDDAVSSFSGR